MPRFAANLSMLFQEVDFLDRFAAAAAAGFAGVEFLFPYAHPAAAIATRLREHDLTQVLFNMPPGDWDAGDRGMAAIPEREAEFARSIDLALEYATALGCPRVHAMAGVVPADAVPGGPARADYEAVYAANLRAATVKAAAHDITVLIEPLNTRDMPGYFINTTGQARRLIEAISEPNLKLQLDLYHCQIMEGDLATRLRALLPITGHIQIAGVPGRHEPDIGEINYPYLFAAIDDVGYDGWIGCEYRPQGRTEDGLGWLPALTR